MCANTFRSCFCKLTFLFPLKLGRKPRERVWAIVGGNCLHRAFDVQGETIYAQEPRAGRAWRHPNRHSLERAHLDFRGCKVLAHRVSGPERKFKTPPVADYRLQLERWFRCTRLGGLNPVKGVSATYLETPLACYNGVSTHITTHFSSVNVVSKMPPPTPSYCKNTFHNVWPSIFFKNHHMQEIVNLKLCWALHVQFSGVFKLIFMTVTLSVFS